MMELGGPNLAVILTNLTGDVANYTTADLLPAAFYLEPNLEPKAN
jgi:cytidine deaminase